MKTYEVLENCHYQGVTWRKGQTAILPQDPDWPERFRAVADIPGEATTTQTGVDSSVHDRSRKTKSDEASRQSGPLPPAKR